MVADEGGSGFSVWFSRFVAVLSGCFSCCLSLEDDEIGGGLHRQRGGCMRFFLFLFICIGNRGSMVFAGGKDRGVCECLVLLR